jgi:hypothetical protein
VVVGGAESLRLEITHHWREHQRGEIDVEKIDGKTDESRENGTPRRWR